MIKKNIIYISDYYTRLSVFESQVHTLCNLHSKHNKVTLIAMCNSTELQNENLLKSDYKIRKIKKIPYNFIHLLNLINVFATVKGVSDDFSNTKIIHCRGHVSSLYAIYIKKLFFKNIKIIADIRGAIVDEIANRKGLKTFFLKYLAKHTENIIFKNADYFFMMSNNMKEYYISEYNIDTNLISIFPTIVDERYFFIDKEARKNKRNELNFNSENTVLVYSGNTEYWQNVDKIIMTFKKMYLKNDKLRLLILTKDLDWVKVFIQNNLSNDNGIVYLSINYKEVGKYLNCADFGLIIRDNTITNYVASPTKINEYLACGLKIIDNLKDMNDLSESQTIYEYKKISNIINEQQLIYESLLK